MNLMLWTVLVYGSHALFAGAQMLLSGYLMVSGLHGVASKETAGRLPRGVGWLRIALGIALVLPVLVGAPFWVSLIASLIAFLTIIFVETRIGHVGRRSGRLARYLIAVTAIVLFGFTLFERADPIEIAQRVFLKFSRIRTTEVSRLKKQDPLTPKAGQMAGDFELSDPRGEKSIRLSDFRGKKPVVMIFGSYT